MEINNSRKLKELRQEQFSPETQEKCNISLPQFLQATNYKDQIKAAARVKLGKEVLTPIKNLNKTALKLSIPTGDNKLLPNH